MSVLGAIGRGARSALAFPFLLVPWRDIAANGRAIDTHARALWGSQGKSSRVPAGVDRAFDPRELVAIEGLSEAQLEDLIVARRRETTRAAYLCMGLGCATFVCLLYRLATTPLSANVVVTALTFSPFCLLFFLLAFQYALQNFRLRIRRRATPLEFLRTNDPFWPR